MAQYQHYIPQFLLRNFAHPYKPPKQKEPKNSRTSRPEKRKRWGEKVLNVIDLSSDEPRLFETPVSRWFGKDNMYSDVDEAIKTKKDLELELSKLESRTAEIFQKVKKAYENGEPGIWLTRPERDRLRKFLFIMKYRGPGYYQKYLGDAQAYDSEDKHLLRMYMAEKGISRPRDVWLHNLRTILDLDMDAKGDWMSKLPGLMFPADAEGFIVHTQVSYTAFCTPAEQHDEFILSDNCYNVFEGPTHETFCAKTGEYLGNTYLSYHEFGPLSPRLIIVLRSCVLPEALEDADPKIQRQRQMMHDGAAVQFPDPTNIKSLLADLPVAKAANTYSKIVNGKLEVAQGELGIPQAKDKFYFRWWPVSTKHVNTINSVFLDNLFRCNSVVFGSSLPFRRTLEAYMTLRSQGFKSPGFGERGARITRLACLEKLSTVLKMLGSKVVPVYCDGKDEEWKATDTTVESFDDVWLEVMKRTVDTDLEQDSKSERTPFWQAFYTLGIELHERLILWSNTDQFILGGSRETFLKDLEQS